MIIFNLDGTLADCEHRMHFVTPPDSVKYIYTDSIPHENGCILTGHYQYHNGELWQPDWKSFYEACDKDKPIHPVIETFKILGDEHEVRIWSGRCESVRHKTELWLWEHAGCGFDSTLTYPQILKMRPIGDNTPDHELKERWLDERIDDMGNQLPSSHDIDFVFDSDPASIEMWRRRGIFVFDCRQS